MGTKNTKAAALVTEKAEATAGEHPAWRAFWDKVLELSAWQQERRRREEAGGGKSPSRTSCERSGTVAGPHADEIGQDGL